MKRQTSTILLFFFFFSFFLFNLSFSLDPKYESCVPMDCGDGRNISYPFFIHGRQDPDCGYPGFELHCNNGSPILQISDNNFTVKQIDYKNRQFRLQNSKFLSNQSDHCSSRIRNITLDPNRFQIANPNATNSTKLLRISNCAGELSAELAKYKIPLCEKSEYVMVENDRNLRKLTDGCGDGYKVAEMPVELAAGEGRDTVVVDGRNYVKVVKRGFEIRWFAADCDGCERSGGRCGFNMTAFQFLCFCPDRPHRVSCKSGSDFYFIGYGGD